MRPAVSFLACVLLGVASALAFAPYFALPLAIAGYAGFALFVRHSDGSKAAFFLGWGFGWGQFAVGLQWITESFFVDADRFGALAWPAVLGLSGFLALFPALAAAATRYLGGRAPAALVIFPAFWTLAEMARSVLLTGFPWNLTGYVWGFSLETLQLVAVVGVHGAGFLTVALCVTPLALAEQYRFRPWALSAAMILVPLMGTGLLWVHGAARLAISETAGDTGLRVRVVQPNIPQDEKWDPDAASRNLDTLRILSVSNASARPNIVIWPETAYPFMFDGDASLPQALLESIPAEGFLLFGAVRVAVDSSEEAAGLWNSLLAVDHTGTLVADYDKIRLVPFGEFMPFRGLPGISKLTAGEVDFVPGSDGSPIRVGGVPPFRALICYEAIFPRPAVDDEQWLVNITNDAWFGLSAGPHQHFLSARVRAIEAGLPMVRAANSGISAIVDGYGRIRQMLPLGVEGVLDAELPPPAGARTLYSKIGDIPALTVIALVLAVQAFRQRRNRSFRGGGRQKSS